MKILICAATVTELNACKKGLSSSNLEVTYLKTGVGPEKSSRSLTEYLENHHPDWIIVTGFALSLHPSIQTGDWVVANSFVDGNNSYSAKSDGFKFKLFKYAPFFLTDHLVTEVKNHHSPAVIDMESVALAKIANGKKIPVSAIRYITDSADHPMPDFVKDWTSALQTDSALKKSLLFTRGFATGLRQPAEMAKFLGNANQWTKSLEIGWREISNSI